MNLLGCALLSSVISFYYFLMRVQYCSINFIFVRLPRSYRHGHLKLIRTFPLKNKHVNLNVFFSALSVPTLHMWAMVHNYLDSQVATSYLFENIDTKFPDVTFCNLLPMSRSVRLRALQFCRLHQKSMAKYGATSGKHVAL